MGDVSERGFEALRLSTWGAWNVFGRSAEYLVCVNSLSLAAVRARTGPVPEAVQWREASRALPDFLGRLFGQDMAEGVAWKLAPLRFFPDCHELSLDNDCILWALPPSIRRWLESPDDAQQCLMAEDVKACHGQFAALCPPGPRNAGIRGLPPHFDLAAALQAVIDARQEQTGRPLALTSELDEQGLQVAALSRAAPLATVSLQEVSVCSPFHPHLPGLGRCGAHFVGLNARHIAWDYYGRPADACMTEHWARHRAELYARCGAPAAAQDGSVARVGDAGIGLDAAQQ
jgi:hypothetical protein